MSAITVSPTAATVGDPLAVTIAIDAPARSVVRLTNPPSTADATRVAVSPWRFRGEGTGWTLTRTETWAAFRTGPVTPLRWTWVVRGPAGTDRTGTLVAPAVTIRSVLPAGRESAAPAPLRPPIARPFVPWQVPAAAGLALAVALLFAAFLRRRRGPRTAPRTADEVFEGELDLLEASLSRSDPEETFYDWLAEITRWYLEQKRGFPAPKQTSSEIAARLGSSGSEAAGNVASVFSVCDGYRFARREHRRDQALAAIAAARMAALALRAEDAAENAAIAPPAEDAAGNARTEGSEPMRESA